MAVHATNRRVFQAHREEDCKVLLFPCYIRALLMTPPAHLVDELAHEVFVCAFRHIGELRKLVNLKYHAEHSSDEIARELKRSNAWVWTTLFRVRQQLKACIEHRLGGNQPC